MKSEYTIPAPIYINSPAAWMQCQGTPATIINTITRDDYGETVSTDEGIQLLLGFIMEHHSPQYFEDYVRHFYRLA